MVKKIVNNKILALDIGVTSLGWAISEFNVDKNELDIVDFGVRLWDAPEDSKTLETNASIRRRFRSSRRLNSRKRQRIIDLKNLFYNSKLITKSDYEFHSNQILTNGKKYLHNNNFNPLILRYKGLTEKLTNLELLISLINLTKRRGYDNRFLVPGLDDDKDSRASIKDADELIKKYKYPIKAIIEDSLFSFDDSGKFIYRSKKFNEKKFDLNSLNLSKEDKELKKKELIEKYKNHQILFNRKDYKNEFEAILNKQIEFNDSLSNIKDSLSEIVFRQRDFEDGPGPKDEILKAKWKDRLNSDPKQFIYKQFFENVGNCQFFPEEKRVSNFSIENDISFILNEISKIFAKINLSEEKVKLLTKEILVSYFDSFKFERKIVNSILDKNNLTLPNLNGISFANSSLFLHNFASVKSNINYLKENLKIDIDFLSSIKNNKINKIGEVLSKNKTPEKLKNKLIELDDFFFNNKDDQYKWIKENKKWINKGNKTLSTSSKFILTALKNQLESGVLISKYQYDLNLKNKEKEISNIDFSKAIEFSLIKDEDMSKNAVVYRAINQTRLVVKNLFKKYNYFDKLIIEVAKDLYAEEKVRKSVRNFQDKNEERKIEAIKILSENNLSVSQINIDKVLIWKEQQLDTDSKKNNYAYDLYDINFKQKINLKSFVNDYDNNFQIDHIAPYSLVNDNSKNNKIITSRIDNSLKNNKSPLDYFISKEYSKKLIESWKSKIEKNIKNNKKVSYLFMSNLNRSTELGFESRNINDTRYITKYIKNYFQIQFEIFAKKYNVKAPKILEIQGGITSNFRRLWLAPKSKSGSVWGDDKKPRDISPFHHAVDAIILSNMITNEHIEFYQSIVRIYSQYNYYVKKHDYKFLKEELLKQKELIKNQFIYKNKLKYNFYKYYGLDYIFSKIESLYDNLISKVYEANLYGKRLERIDFYNDKYAFEIISPLIKNLPQKVNNLIPVKLTFSDEIKKIYEYKNPLTNEIEKIEKTEKNPKYDKVIEPKEWSKLNNRNISEYPYVSYKINKKIRGNLFGSELSNKIKGSIDIKTKTLKKNIITDKHGNNWDISKYIGYSYNKENKLTPIYRYDIFEKAKNREKINLALYRNAQFKLPNDDNVYVYRGVKNFNKIIISSNSNLSQLSGEKFKSIFKFYPIKYLSKINELKLVNINNLGKIVS